MQRRSCLQRKENKDETDNQIKAYTAKHSDKLNRRHQDTETEDPEYCKTQGQQDPYTAWKSTKEVSQRYSKFITDS